MNYLVKNTTIIDPTSPHHLQVMDILVVDGIIKSIAAEIVSNDAKVIEGNALYTSIGLCDIGVQGGDPGYESKEDMNSLTLAALNGGYTQLAVFPTLNPYTQTKSDVFYLTNHEHRNGVNIIAIGALSQHGEGKEIAEYLDLHESGCNLFSDGLNAIENHRLLQRAMSYVTQFDGTILLHPTDRQLAVGGQMHEGEMSTKLGMTGIPSLAELVPLFRDLELREYNDCNLVVHCVATAGGLELLARAKGKTQKLFASCAYKNLFFRDEDLHDYDSNLKLKPVLRGEEDRVALVEGLKNGIIDFIVTNHHPIDEEGKVLEFAYAKSGAIGLETCLPACIDELKNILPIDKIIEKLTINPRKIAGINIPTITEGTTAELCIFDTNQPWIYTHAHSKSKSKNTPFVGQRFMTKVVKVIC